MPIKEDKFWVVHNEPEVDDPFEGDTVRHNSIEGAIDVVRLIGLPSYITEYESRKYVEPLSELEDRGQLGHMYQNDEELLIEGVTLHILPDSHH